jgi:CRP-like cAMP-binding protein
MSRRWVDVTERAIYLRSIPVTAELPANVLHAVARSLVDRELPAGTKVLETGKSVRALQLVTAGRLELQKAGSMVGELVPPQSVGFLNLLGQNDAAYDAVATEPIASLELSGERLWELMEDHYPLLVATLRYLAQRLLAEMQSLPQQMLGLPAMELPMAVPDRPLDLVEKVFFMRCVSAYKNTNLGALAVLAELMIERRAPAGTTFFLPGEKANFTLFLVEGFVTCETADGRVFEYGPGTAVGGVESLANRERWYSAHAKTPVVALSGKADDLVALMEDNFEIGTDFIRMLSLGLQGLMAAKAARGAATFAVKRDVSNLKDVPVGA